MMGAESVLILKKHRAQLVAALRREVDTDRRLALYGQLDALDRTLARVQGRALYAVEWDGVLEQLREAAGES